RTFAARSFCLGDRWSWTTPASSAHHPRAMTERKPRAPMKEAPLSPPRVLAVAGSDSSGGAGIQADLKTLTAPGVYGASAITAITVQSTLGVTDVMPIPASVVGAQMDAVLDDIGADVIKTGMLVSVDIVRAVAQRARCVSPGVRLVIDPVILASDGRE